MDLVRDILKTAAAPAVYIYRRLGLEADFEPDDYESTTTRMPEFRTEGPTLVRWVGRSHHDSPEHNAHLVLSLPLYLVRDSTDPEGFRYIVANAAAESYDELRRLLRAREEQEWCELNEEHLRQE